ncbi:GntR family transcriptional regulator [Ureibacillus massiliensis 4400831 = CIP 108448 = CCUG 49529]|uniref:GntR family transcriptional regulator n=1 Tax=Ureibacillus massiliensis 4400831 = CIP 108448 = CCUG 49529 TaxID=1211035 RepID=A0A0A3J4E5_9BACL|nr:TrkA C-terminal domain-containing protein [Ureibacillus massiliensis]KGR91771.1 GntR family transcriptional regulator [Ureibacillus massiliensis 4400831 = CIP 108448 = CCUG 49529]
MDNRRLQVKQPKYMKIAADIASKIVDKKYVIGEKIYARSSLASQYGVSSETARRAIAVLQDLEIVEATKGSGVMIKSSEKAAQFVHQFLDVQSIQQIQMEMLESIKRQRDELAYLQETTEQLVSRTERFRSVNPFVPFQIEILESSPYISQTIGSINFWQNTMATIVGIRRESELILSPGPYATIEKNDIIYFIGNDESIDRVEKFLYPI